MFRLAICFKLHIKRPWKIVKFFQTEIKWFRLQTFGRDMGEASRPSIQTDAQPDLIIQDAFKQWYTLEEVTMI
jgi:hypothetical protein